VRSILRCHAFGDIRETGTFDIDKVGAAKEAEE
jgi:hypothetical protein